MISNLSYKRKFFLFLAGVFLLIWISVAFAFSRTSDLKRELELRRQQLSAVGNAPAKLNTINERLTELEKLIGKESEEETGTYLMEKAGTYCRVNGLFLVEIPQVMQYHNNDFTITTHTVVLQGGFKGLLGFLYEMEYNSSIGELRSAAFHSEYSLRKRKTELFGTYYIQTVSSSKLKIRN